MDFLFPNFKVVAKNLKRNYFLLQYKELLILIKYTIGRNDDYYKECKFIKYKNCIKIDNILFTKKDKKFVKHFKKSFLYCRKCKFKLIKIINSKTGENDVFHRIIEYDVLNNNFVNELDYILSDKTNEINSIIVEFKRVFVDYQIKYEIIKNFLSSYIIFSIEKKNCIKIKCTIGLEFNHKFIIFDKIFPFNFRISISKSEFQIVNILKGIEFLMSEKPKSPLYELFDYSDEIYQDNTSKLENFSRVLEGEEPLLLDCGIRNFGNLKVYYSQKVEFDNKIFENIQEFKNYFNSKLNKTA